jgi:hypothetical protein
MIKMTEQDRQALSAEVRTWRGDATVREAAAVLDIPFRTLEGVEAGRGFNYPKLLRLAMKTWKAPKNGK